jgi:hypothetical protein
MIPAGTVERGERKRTAAEASRLVNHFFILGFLPGATARAKRGLTPSNCGGDQLLLLGFAQLRRPSGARRLAQRSASFTASVCFSSERPRCG